jgi:hypothetical protein
MSQLIEWIYRLNPSATRRSPVSHLLSRRSRATTSRVVAPIISAAPPARPVSRSTVAECPPENGDDRSCSVHRYASLAELRELLNELAKVERLTLLLVLDANLREDLRSLIQRSNNPGYRLILCTASGRLPGLLTIGDLSSSSTALGWQSIVFDRDTSRAMHDALRSTERNEKFAILLPATFMPDELSGIGQQADAAKTGVMVWKREWCAVLLTLVVGVLLYFVGGQLLPLNSRFGYAARFGCTIATGWLWCLFVARALTFSSEAAWPSEVLASCERAANGPLR